jgi:hypothetical protein
MVMVGVIQKLLYVFPCTVHVGGLCLIAFSLSAVIYGIEIIHWKGWWHCLYQRVSQLTNDSYVKFEVLMAVILLGSGAMCIMHVITAT